MCRYFNRECVIALPICDPTRGTDLSHFTYAVVREFEEQVEIPVTTINVLSLQKHTSMIESTRGHVQTRAFQPRLGNRSAGCGFLVRERLPGSGAVRIALRDDRDAIATMC